MCARVSIQDLKQLEEIGLNICDSVCFAFKTFTEMKSKSFKIRYNYPFKETKFHYSYALKYALLGQ